MAKGVKAIAIQDMLTPLKGGETLYDSYKKAIETVYSKHKVIDKVEVKGTLYFVVEG